MFAETTAQKNTGKLPLRHRETHGFTLIELMIVVAIIAIVLTLALPVYSNYVIRAKVSEGLSVANAAKTAISTACVENRAITDLDNAQAGYAFDPGIDDTDYVASVEASGPCTDPLITVTTRHTGRVPAPILLLQGALPAGVGQITWRCYSDNTPSWLLPEACRS